jgi:hypothetical protein
MIQRLRETQINPAIVGGICLAVVVLIAYFAWIRPMQAAEQAKRNWATAEAAEKRGPGRQVDPSFQAKVQEKLAKEGHNRGNRTPRRKDETE